MAFRDALAVALILSCTPALGDDAAAPSLDGTWLPTSAEIAGRPFPEDVRKTIRLEILGDRYTATVAGQSDRGTCQRDPSTTPPSLTIVGTDGPNAGKTIPAIYERTGPTLKVCYDLSGTARPTSFKTTPGTQLFLVEYTLQK